MKANELRIGNLLNHNNGSMVGSFIVGLIHLEDIIKENPHAREYEPIPLTEEWLLRLGFEKPAHSWNGKIFHLSQWDAYPLNWCVAMDKNGAVIVHKLKYVHQLQNLYFALTNEELTMK
jgi:hypothetical protein